MRSPLGEAGFKKEGVEGGWGCAVSTATIECIKNRANYQPLLFSTVSNFTLSKTGKKAPLLLIDCVIMTHLVVKIFYGFKNRFRIGSPGRL